jgi:hypothetical protein
MNTEKVKVLREAKEIITYARALFPLINDSYVGNKLGPEASAFCFVSRYVSIDNKKVVVHQYKAGTRYIRTVSGMPQLRLIYHRFDREGRWAWY